MPYRRNDYSFTIDSSFRPFELQELMTPFLMYKDAYEKNEEAYNELTQKADTFKYLAKELENNPDSQAAQIYKGYADELNKQAEDLAKHGLSMNNRRALTNLKRRYQGEIGLLDAAKSAMDKEKERRLALSGKDSSMLYAEDNLNLDQFLGEKTPNLYSVSGEDLRKEAAQYAQAASSRIYGDTRVQDINKYFQDIIQTQGYSPEVLAAWRQNLETIPEFNMAVEDIMSARGVTGNLTGANYERARQNIINGIMEGSVYQEKRSAQQNPGVLTAAQADASARGWASHNLSAAAAGMVRDPSSPTGYRYDINHDPKLANNLWMYKVEDGQIKGYSDEYLKAVKDGAITPSGRPKAGNSNTPKTSKVDLLEDESYDTNTGYTSAAPTGQNATYGKEISMAKAMELAPDLVSATGEMRNYYRYYKYGTKITRRRMHSSVTTETEEATQPTQQNSTATGNGSNHNVI